MVKVDIPSFESSLKQILGLLSSIRSHGGQNESGLLDSRQQLVMKLVFDFLNKKPMEYDEITQFFLDNKISRSTAYSYAQKISNSICIKNAEGKLSLKKGVKTVLNLMEKKVDVPFFTFEEYNIKREDLLFKFIPIEWISFISVSTGFDLASCVQLLKKALDHIEKKNGKVINESDLVYEITKILEKKYSGKEAEQLYALYKTQVFHFHSKKITPFDLRKATDAVVRDLGEDSKKYVLDALWKLQQAGIREVSPFALKMWILTVLCNAGEPFSAAVDALMWYGISKTEYEYITSKYVDEDFAIASKIRERHITISVLESDEYNAIRDGDIWVHYLTQCFGLRPIMVSLNSIGIMTEGIFGHTPPSSIQVARSHLMQTIFTFPPVANDLTYDFLNYGFAEFANATNTKIDPKKDEYIQDEMSQQIQGFLCEMNHFLNWPAGRITASINISLQPPPASNLVFSEEKKTFAHHIALKLLRLVEYGDAGRTFVYPIIFFKVYGEVDESIQRLLARIYITRRKTDIHIVNMDHWKNGTTPFNIVFGEHQNSITSRTSNWPAEIYDTGICGLVSVNLPRMALEEKNRKAGDDFLKRSVQAAVGILKKNKDLIVEKNQKRVSSLASSVPFFFEKAIHCIGIVGLREYLEFSGLDPIADPEDSMRESIRILSEIKKLFQDEMKTKGVGGRCELAQTFWPVRRIFLRKDKEKYGSLREKRLADLQSYTSGCSLFTQNIFPTERIPEIPSQAEKELTIFNLTQGGCGPMFNFRLVRGKKWEIGDITEILNGLIKKRIPIFSLSLLE